ncbi:cupin [Pseudodesulfovibrio sp. zrk46]|uniref:cupin domain-containing protein n=1 Tax=Pseudodesulfovibrio sp. zrk46 TaxID=2725288 RepID=UPI001449EBBC|nr:cupin [Pseudodesulfovibrio sp. zrk46]QJB55772.1 cupin [Pseudodesulfovibrio sp. zrk46]
MDDLFTHFSSGIIAQGNSIKDAKNLSWNPHPSNAGVSLKHLVTGSETDGRFSVHLVKLDAGAEIGEHVHENHWELHEVAGGDGVCLLEMGITSYGPGDINVLPENIKHYIKAGENGLLLMAKFIPALL